MNSIDLNCDLGEGFGIYSCGEDAAMMELISSANIACGAHAGDPAVMDSTVRLALKHGVAVGAHPGYPDREGFGRRNIRMTPKEIYQMVLYQLGALNAFIQAAGGRMHHVKAHGALYNLATVDEKTAVAITLAIRDFDPALIIYGMFGGKMINAAHDAGIKTAVEAFIERRYNDDGSLLSRDCCGSVLENQQDAIEQGIRLITDGTVKSISGRIISVKAETVCLHGDNPSALDLARNFRNYCEKESICIKCL